MNLECRGVEPRVVRDDRLGLPMTSGDVDALYVDSRDAIAVGHNEERGSASLGEVIV